jgi:hypothetical protein
MSGTSEATSTSSVSEQTWSDYKDALGKVMSEMAPPGGGGGAVDAPSTESLRQMVNDAVSAVLIESNFLEKFVSKKVKSFLEGEGKEPVREICKEAMRTFSFQKVGSVLRQEIKQIVQSRLLEFGNSEEFKDILDSRFRTMEQYMRSDVIPRVLKQIEAQT